jgi:hypothetical protein
LKQICVTQKIGDQQVPWSGADGSRSAQTGATQAGFAIASRSS